MNKSRPSWILLLAASKLPFPVRCSFYSTTERPHLYGSSSRVIQLRRRKWDTLINGDLLKAAEAASFQVFITTDKNIRYQQNLSEHAIAIVVLGIPQWPILRPHVDHVVAAVNAAKPGTYCEVEIPER